jgi:ectoine hydroxylase-related dioxygenase (phytanoyl-CoA dioxygenase family)
MPPVFSLTTTDKEFFTTNGWFLTEPLSAQDVDKIQESVSAIHDWPMKTDNASWLHYQEMTVHGPRLCRTENFTPFHEGMFSLLRQGALVDIASQLMGEQAVLYKEKINYKLAGGAGYSPHQDAPAYPFVDTHISCMVAVDDATIENGCLEVVSQCHQEVLSMDTKGCIDPALVANFRWDPVELRAGQVLWFHSRTPHRSGPNNSHRDRRALYPTYNALREGDLRAAYYEQKLREFNEQEAAGGTVRVSLIGDFEGKPV